MARPVVQLLVLLLAIPAQYLITIWSSQTTNDSSIKVRKLVTTLSDFGKKWIQPKTWLDELKRLWFYLTDNRGECVAVEVMKYRSNVGYFANSPRPRHERPPKMKYRIGQVFLHKSAGYHGVIVGWDDHARATDTWLENVYGREAAEKRLEPHYAVLPDQSENDNLHAYVSQDDIEIVLNRKIENSLIDDYFEAFNGIGYEPRQFLKKLYPKD
ncbi:uncharacterized protein LOC114539799 [Dendronephthya gigantea]|uniref:uncharacterized protein LOC114539799 n=1 Tax=Dendronephthya gigantea TaxID=151771 RepID=UPI00106CE09F|nr:uncharacterized protein LOC114539799 [Dendronephthya gigantea]